MRTSEYSKSKNVARRTKGFVKLDYRLLVRLYVVIKGLSCYQHQYKDQVQDCPVLDGALVFLMGFGCFYLLYLNRYEHSETLGWSFSASSVYYQHCRCAGIGCLSYPMGHSGSLAWMYPPAFCPMLARIGSIHDQVKHIFKLSFTCGGPVCIWVQVGPTHILESTLSLESGLVQSE